MLCKKYSHGNLNQIEQQIVPVKKAIDSKIKQWYYTITKLYAIKLTLTLI